MQRWTRWTLIATLPVGLMVSSCDTKIIDDDAPALIDLTPGPTQGVVARGDDARRVGQVGPEAQVLEGGLNVLDALRETMGLPQVARSAPLTAAAQLHADYVVANEGFHDSNDISPHLQVEGLPGYVGEKATDRVEHADYDGVLLGEVIGYQQTAPGTMRAWIESLYHRLPLLRREATEIGIGGAVTEAGFQAHVVEVGATLDAMADDAGNGAFIAYPYDGQQDVPTEWSGQEVPQPQAPPMGYPSGPVVTLSAVFGSVEVDTAVMRVEGGDIALPVTVLSRANDARVQPRDVAVIAHSPLSPGTRYRVEVSGKVDGSAFFESWSFVTRPGQCDILGDSCGPGQACYVANGERMCRYEGANLIGDSCHHVDDCAAGLSCFGATCQPMCEASGAGSCETSCVGRPHVGTSVPGVDVCLTESCSADSCSDGQGCYYLNGLACAWSGAGELGSACAFANDCQAGLTCLGANTASFRCHTLCDGPGMPTCTAVCTSGEAILLDNSEGAKACL